MSVTNSAHELSARCGCGHVQVFSEQPFALDESIYCSACGAFITSYTSHAPSPKPQATHPGATSSNVATGQVPQATDGGASEHGCSAPRSVEPPAAVCGVSDSKSSIAPAAVARSMTRSMNRCNCGAVMQPSISRVVKLCHACDTYALIPVDDGDVPISPAEQGLRRALAAIDRFQSGLSAHVEFHRAADAALDALTNLHGVINRHRSRLTVREVATIKQQIQLIHHTIKLSGLRDAARPDDLPGSRPEPQSRLALKVRWGGQ